MPLPPGQRLLLPTLPRFGTHLWRPPPDVPDDATVTIRGAGLTETIVVPVRDLTDGSLGSRREVVADFHCVSGWSTTDVVWSGVSFAEVWESLVQPRLHPGAEVSHVRVRGWDGVPATLWLEDALDPSVLLADRLEGSPLGGDHGGPLRLVSPRQYGYMSIKHLRVVDIFDRPPPGPGLSLMDGLLIRRHPRARVAQEERNGIIPNPVVRPLYRLLRGPALAACRRAVG